MKILLADDHALIRSGLRNELEELEAAVEFVEAWDADSLRQMLDRHVDLDLALVDLTMPGMDGARTIGALREAHPTIPLIVLSGADPVAELRAHRLNELLADAASHLGRERRPACGRNGGRRDRSRRGCRRHVGCLRHGERAHVGECIHCEVDWIEE